MGGTLLIKMAKLSEEIRYCDVRDHSRLVRLIAEHRTLLDELKKETEKYANEVKEVNVDKSTRKLKGWSYDKTRPLTFFK